MNISSALVVLLVSGVALAGCASPSTREAEGVKQYCAQRYADPRLEPIKDKIVIPVSVDEPQPIEILANKSRPTEPERTAIRVLSEIRKDCNDYAAKLMGTAPAYRQKSQDEISMALADLYAGELTYGQFAKAVLHIGDRDKAAREDIEQAIQQRDRWQSVDVYN